MIPARPTLEAWINEEHLGDERLASYRARFEQNPLRLLVIDNVLREQAALRLSSALLDDSEYQSTFGIWQDPPAPVAGAKPGTPERHCKVDRQQWEATRDDQRFYRYRIIKGARPERRFSAEIMSYLRFRSDFAGPHFTAWFEAVTGLPLGGAMFDVHRMESGDYLRRHTDDSKGRQIAFVLYLTPGWHAGLGGTLSLNDPDGNRVTVPAIYNRLVIFDVKSGTEHEVAPVSVDAGEQARVSIGGWVLQRPDTAETQLEAAYSDTSLNLVNADASCNTR